MNLPGDNNTHLILGMQNPIFPGAFFPELNPIFQGEPCVETTIPEGPWGLNHLWPGTASSQAAIGYCCLHAGLTLENCVLHSQDHKGIVVSRQVHPIECQVGLRSAGPIPPSRFGPGVSNTGQGQAGPVLHARPVDCREMSREEIRKNLKKQGPAASMGPAPAAGCWAAFFKCFILIVWLWWPQGLAQALPGPIENSLKEFHSLYKSSFLLCH